MERLTLDEHLSSAAMARHWVCDHCPDEHLPEARRWIAELLTSELVANALAHSSGPVLLTLTHDAEGIVVGISDGNTSVPSLQSQNPGATQGRGIALVDALATTWGFYPSHAVDASVEATDGPGWPEPDDVWDTSVVRSGKTVWFHLSSR